MKKYNPTKIESKWQKYWEKEKMHEAVAGSSFAKASEGRGRNFMLLVEFPYPSGNLHIGHWYAFALPDILARYQKMNGKNVMYPIGFDAFGLPAENAAIQRETSPSDWTKKNIAYMTKQLKSMGATFDWSRQVETIDPEYYQWTQWMFLKFYEKDLAYRAETPVNWCSKDKTVLANEQVVNGKCDRCGTDVEQRKLSQWMFRITQFADDLVDGLDRVDWPETTKLAQRNWIGRSEGSEIEFRISNSEFRIKVFTTRADTLFGATYVVLAPENELVKDLKPFITNWDEVEKYITEAKRKSELERMTNVKSKTGAQIKGVSAINPINGEETSVWVADYVLAHYGTGAVMAVPAHDQRDYDFARKHQIEIREVIAGGDIDKKAYEEDGKLINSQKFDGLTSEEARTKIVEELKSKGLGKLIKQYRLHDWILSRQRYWGVPIPLVFCKNCAANSNFESLISKNNEKEFNFVIRNGEKYAIVPVPERDLPIKLPKLDDFKPSDDGRSPLAKSGKWLKAKCPKCGGEAERETDTMDTFVDSSWYFMRYTDPNNKEEFASQENMDAWLPVPLYVGGAEHNTMHLLYSRFFTKALHSLGYVKFDEPFLGRINHGIILGPDGQKMSKSRGNVVDPDVEVKNYGADTVRMYLSFMGPYEQGGPWDPKGINGVSRFLNRIWNFVSRYEDKKLKVCEKPEIDIEITRAIKNVGDDIKELKFNTGVSGLMKMLNSLEEIAGEEYKLSKEQYELILKVIAPYAPHIAEELWQEVLGNEKSIHLESWPKYDATLLEEQTINLVVQVNGKMRGTILMKAGLPEEEVKKLVMANDKIQKYLDGQAVKKFIYISGRVANIVV